MASTVGLFRVFAGVARFQKFHLLRSSPRFGQTTLPFFREEHTTEQVGGGVVFHSRGNSRNLCTHSTRISTDVDLASAAYSHGAEVYGPSWEIHSAAKIGKALQDSDNSLEVTWQDGGAKAKFSLIWLRDNCRCPACYSLPKRVKLYTR